MFPNNKRFACALFSKLSLAFIAGTALTLSSSSLFASEAGSLFVTDLATGSVIVYDSTGAGTTFDTGLTSPQGITFAPGPIIPRISMSQMRGMAPLAQERFLNTTFRWEAAESLLGPA